MRQLFLFAALCLISCGENEDISSRQNTIPIVKSPGQEEVLKQQRLAQKEMEEAEIKAREIKERLLHFEKQLK